MAARLMILLALAWVGVGAAFAEMGEFDPVPAATLLLPYFEVDPSDSGSGVNTVFTVRNASPAPAIAHVMVFTDYSVGTLAFDIFLPGYASDSIDLRALFRNEAEPVAGGFSLALSRDTPVLPSPPPPVSEVFSDSFESGKIDRWTIHEARASEQTMTAFHTGGMSEREFVCAGQYFGDEIVRGYVLVDNVSVFVGDRFPETSGYFAAGGTGMALNDNVLWGEFEIRRPAFNYSFGERLVSIEADDGTKAGAKGGVPTFYERYVNGDGRDGREALSDTWSTRYLLGGAIDVSSVLYWRDPGQVQTAIICGTTPSYVPLTTNRVVLFNEEGDGVESGLNDAFPIASGIVDVGSGSLSTPFDFGWLFAEFAAPPAQGGGKNQAVVLATYNSSIGFSLGVYGLPSEDFAPIEIESEAE